MLKVSNRGCEEGVIKSSVKDGKSIYTITASRNENGKFSIFVSKNKKDYTLYSNIGASVKYVNKKIIEISNFYNSSNNILRLKSIVHKEQEVEKNHKRLVKMREDKLKKLNSKKKVQKLK